jgi:hypothetical protein
MARSGSDNDGEGSPSACGQGPLRGRDRGGGAVEDALAEGEALLATRVTTHFFTTHYSRF